VVAGPLPYFQDAHMIFDLPLPQTRVFTPYTLYGDWLVVVFVLVLLVSLRPRRRL